MGGHSAWRKRVASGELAKGSGGAINRHRPHFGRTGKDIEENRKGNIGGGNPKKMKKETAPEARGTETAGLLVYFSALLAAILAVALLGWYTRILLSNQEQMRGLLLHKLAHHE